MSKTWSAQCDRGLSPCHTGPIYVFYYVFYYVYDSVYDHAID